MFDFIDDFIDDPIGTTVHIATQPVRDTIDITDGLLEWEIRTEAATRVWVDIAWWAILNELLDDSFNF